MEETENRTQLSSDYLEVGATDSWRGQVKLQEAGSILDVIQGRFKEELKAETSSGIF